MGLIVKQTEICKELKTSCQTINKCLKDLGMNVDWRKFEWEEDDLNALKECIKKRQVEDRLSRKRKYEKEISEGKYSCRYVAKLLHSSAKRVSELKKKLRLEYWTDETIARVRKEFDEDFEARSKGCQSDRVKKLLSEKQKGKEHKTFYEIYSEQNPDFKGIFAEEAAALKDFKSVAMFRRNFTPKFVYFKNKKLCYYLQEDLEKIDKNIPSGSLPEKEIADFLEHYAEIERCTRSVIKPKELDIYIPSKKVAIEFNGLYWHSLKPRKYHFEKYQICKEKGIRCIQIFEDEWRDKKEIVKSILLSAIGVYERKVFARKCIVKEIDKKTANSFLDENHLNGSVKTAQKAFGLFLRGELLQVITVGKNRFAKDGKLELLRMASKLNTQVVGGFSKILKDSGIHEIESYVDNRIYSGSGYESSGWKVIGSSGPSYFYTNWKIRKNRMSMMKSKLPGEGTEEQRANSLGWYRVYDCGTTKLKYEV